MHRHYETDLQFNLARSATARYYQQILAELADAQYNAQKFRVSGVDAAIRAADLNLVQTRWADEERRTKHETAGYVAALRTYVAPELRPYVYLGLTSSDLIDTAAAWQFKEIRANYLAPSIHMLIGLMITEVHCTDELRMGRTHGRLAEPVPISSAYLRAAEALQTVSRDLHNHQIPGKLSGPVGEYNSALSPEIADSVGRRLGIPMNHGASQIVDRHYYRRVAADLIEVIAVCEQLATLHRLSAIEGVDTFSEGFAPGQKGSSVMAFKRNPIRSERICGLARVARGHYMALLETWSTSWWERDLTNSSVERTAWWDLVQLCHYLVKETIGVIEEGAWRSDVPTDYHSRTEELIQRSLSGQDPEQVYREIQARKEGAGSYTHQPCDGCGEVPMQRDLYYAGGVMMHGKLGLDDPAHPVREPGHPVIQAPTYEPDCDCEPDPMGFDCPHQEQRNNGVDPLEWRDNNGAQETV